MTNAEIQAVVLRCLVDVAPEVDTSQLKPDVSLRDQLDLDSMDFLNFIIAVHDTLHVEIPESDYAKVATLNGSIEYLASRLRAAGR